MRPYIETRQKKEKKISNETNENIYDDDDDDGKKTKNVENKTKKLASAVFDTDQAIYLYEASY